MFTVCSLSIFTSEAGKLATEYEAAVSDGAHYQDRHTQPTLRWLQQLSPTGLQNKQQVQPQLLPRHESAKPPEICMRTRLSPKQRYMKSRDVSTGMKCVVVHVMQMYGGSTMMSLRASWLPWLRMGLLRLST